MVRDSGLRNFNSHINFDFNALKIISIYNNNLISKWKGRWEMLISIDQMKKKSLTKVISPPLGSFWFLITDLLKGENIF